MDSLSRAIALAICTVLLLITSSFTYDEALAFKTFRAVGGNVHEQILREALTGLVSEEQIKIIDWACTRNDDPASDRFTDPRHHFDSNKIDKSLEYVRARMESAVAYAERADTDEQQRRSCLKAMGDLLHSIHDFYAHSNYIELMLKAGTPPEKIEPINWDRRPAGLKACYFHCDGLLDNEAFRSRDTCIAKLHKQFFDTDFATKAEKAKLIGKPGSYEGAIAFATSQYDFLHFELNKDNASQEQGKIIHPESGLTLYEIARRVAVKETRRQWKTLLDRIRAEYPDRASAIVSAISGMKIAVPTQESPRGNWTCTIQEHPFGSSIVWAVWYENRGNTLIIHLVQDPERNPFDREHPGLKLARRGMGEGTDYDSVRRKQEQYCERFRRTGRLGL